jgi:hypothetical protein
VKKFTHITLLLLFLQPQISNSVVWLNYIFQQDYITKTFCVNTDKPELMCNGQCHLNMQLNQSESSEPEVPEPLSLTFQINLFYTEARVDLIEVGNAQQMNGLIQPFYAYHPNLKIDKPPKSASLFIG